MGSCVCGHVEHYSPPGETSCLVPECPCVTFQVDVREDGATALRATLEVATKALRCTCGHIEHYPPPGEMSCLVPECPCATFEPDPHDAESATLRIRLASATKALEEIRDGSLVLHREPVCGACLMPVGEGVPHKESKPCGIASRALATIRGGETKSVDEP